MTEKKKGAQECRWRDKVKMLKERQAGTHSLEREGQARMLEKRKQDIRYK